MLVVIVAAGLVGGLIGGFIGQKALKKHFIKAGLDSVKYQEQPPENPSYKRRQTGCLDVYKRQTPYHKQEDAADET